MLMFTLIDGEKLTYDTALVPDLKGNVDGEITPETVSEVKWLLKYLKMQKTLCWK